MSSPIPQQTITFDVHDCKIAPMLTDTSTEDEPTYGAWLDVPGIQQFQLNPQFITAELKGDGKTLDNRAKTSGFDVTANYAMLDLQVMKALLGGTYLNTGGVEASWTLGGDNSIPYVRIAFSIEDVSSGLGNVAVLLNKAKVSGGSLFDQQTDQYGTRSMQLSAIPPLSEAPIIDIKVVKTKTPIVTLWPIA
jgi:hypothetical protein